MATDFGFYPTTSGEHYFISYNTEDTNRVKPVAYTLHKSGVPLWYDFGLEYGEEWERQIAANIRSAKAVIMFITAGIFRKERSYVRKEFDIARMYKIHIIPVLLDAIDTYSVPTQYAAWWVDVAALQGVNGVGYDAAGLARVIMYALENMGNNLPSRGDAAPKPPIPVGSFVKLGSYPQNLSYPEPITWRVLDFIDGRALMISEELLDAHKFDAKNKEWETSELGGWLNSDFLMRAFTADERERLAALGDDDDKVTLLSTDEAEWYFSGDADRKAEPTAYAIKNGAFVNNGAGWWWLRSPGYYSIDAALVVTDGSIYDIGGGVSNVNLCVRPVVLASL